MVLNEVFLDAFRFLTHVGWESFFFVTKAIGWVIAGELFHMLPALILLSLVIAIEAYTLHRLVKVPCTLAVPRMIAINLIDILVESLVVQLLLYRMMDLSKYVHSFYPHMYTIFSLRTLAIVILFFVRYATACAVYSIFDKSVDKLALRKAMLRANGYSYLFVVAVLTVFRIVTSDMYFF